ncbi:MAG TPA: hypothetical protein VMP03_07405 [Methylomirabilota bacterium]|nr:hypothetical protein [Methylomirabilota bacterium]
MADYYLIGNLEDDDDLYLVNTSDRSVSPVPSEVWEDVVAMFQAGDPAKRQDAAADVLSELDAARSAGRPVKLALSANDLGEILVTMRIECVERAMEQNAALDAALRPHIAYGAMAA